MEKRNILRVASLTVGALLVPFVAMQFTEQVDWKLGDFVIGGVLLFGTGLAISCLLEKVTKSTHRFIAVIVVLVVLLLVWAELSVGIFGTLFAGS